MTSLHSSPILVARARQLLEQMGIDVWQLRQSETAEAIPQAEPADPVVAETGAAAAENPAVAGARPAAQVARQAAVAPFTVLCLSRPGAVLLIEPAEPRTARRFAADLLSAVTGTWGGEIRQLAFEWPQPGIEQSGEAVARALGAFVGKQLADNTGSTVLVGEEVAARLGAATLPRDCLRIPSFDALITDGKLKRALWRDVGLHRLR